jgi:hypothetical protein
VADVVLAAPSAAGRRSDPCQVAGADAGLGGLPDGGERPGAAAGRAALADRADLVAGSLGLVPGAVSGSARARHCRGPAGGSRQGAEGERAGQARPGQVRLQVGELDLVSGGEPPDLRSPPTPRSAVTGSLRPPSTDGRRSRPTLQQTALSCSLHSALMSDGPQAGIISVMLALGPDGLRWWVTLS